ncbi:radical SAM/SPASM domain-containing protein [Paenibacillus tyrfis]|uniref:radical SAM/SPASM domain-containing protein n=1 Tax=Paenibacillus tyrfis TaxID=1501230 RepID=UPI000B596BC9|nr:radical SAM protein [Paenibacillus tyrfis]
MFKISKFNVPFAKEGNFFLYNSHTSSFVKLNDEYRESLRSINNKQFESIPQKHLDDLLEAGFIVKESKDENAFYTYIHNMNRFGSTNFHLTIATTLQCNFRCPYCYEEHVDEYIEGEKEEDLKKFIQNNIQNKSGLSITWYGGEPLLKKDLIDRVSKFAIELCESRGITYSASMVSNGYLLNRETAKKLANENNVRQVQITLDGGPETHNITRILRNGMGSFDIIMKNIKQIYDIMSVNIRVNVSKENVADVYKLLPILIDEGLNQKVGVYFAPVEPINTSCQSVSESCLITKEFSKWEMELIEYADKIGFQIGELYPSHRGASICQAVVQNQYVIDAYGDIFKCWHEVGNKTKRIGSLSEGLTNEENLLKWMNWQLPAKCETCNIMPLCKGRCPDLSLNKEDKNNFECHQLKYNVKDRLFRYYQRSYLDSQKINSDELSKEIGV